MSQEQQDYSHLADEIRGVKPQEPETAGAHAGSEHVPEDIRERPVEGVSVPIDPTIDPEDVPIPDSPAHVDMLPEERTHERLVALQSSPEPAIEQPGKKSRRGLIGGLAGIVAVATLGGVLYMTNKGGDHSSEVTDPNSSPTPTATTSGPSQPESSEPTQSESPSTNVLDPSIKPIEQSGIVDPSTEFATLQDHVSYDSVNRLINPDAVNHLRNSSNPEVQQFMQKYVPDTYPNYSMSLLTANSDVVNELYDTVAWQSKFYGEPQNFKSSESYKDIGQLPYATHKDIEDAYFNGSSAELFQKLFNTRIEYGNNVLLDELKAGNKSPALGRDLATWTSSRYVSADGSKAQGIQTVAQEYDQIIQQYKNPEQFEVLLPTTTSAKLVEANVLSASRQQLGVEFTSDNQIELKNNGITTVAVELKTAVKSSGDAAPTVQDTLYVGALVPVPDGSAGNGEHLQFIALGPAVNVSGS
jgi:hypothetical protein